jgi:hypothetical protein
MINPRTAVLAAAALALVPTTLHAETLTVFPAAPDQAAMKLDAFQSPVAGARVLNLDVGVGSALFHDPKDPPNVYWTLSDRGANFTCDEAVDLMGVAADAICPAADGVKAGAGRVYPTPDYNVAIYQITLDPASSTFTVTKTLPMTTPKGNPIVGLTNPLTIAATEVPRDGSGKPIAQNANSIDAEGFVRLPDGRFFIGEENTTGVAELSPEGVIVRRFVPAGTEKDFATADYPVSGSLPAILAKRTSNRGIESLSMSDDGQYLYALVQNPLSNPDAKAYGTALNTRLLKLQLGKDGDATTLTPVAEYVYQLDDWQNFKALGATDAAKASSLRISEMTALGHDHFLVDERTDQIAKIFEITLDGATNILGTPWDDAATSPTLEQSNDLSVAGIVPVTKTERLVASSLEMSGHPYPAKIEGMSLTPDGKLLLVNDNDFGIAGDTTRFVLVDGTDIGPR